jgi:hypothetical protein
MGKCTATLPKVNFLQIWGEFLTFALEQNPNIDIEYKGERH